VYEVRLRMINLLSETSRFYRGRVAFFILFFIRNWLCCTILGALQQFVRATKSQSSYWLLTAKISSIYSCAVISPVKCPNTSNIYGYIFLYLRSKIVLFLFLVPHLTYFKIGNCNVCRPLQFMTHWPIQLLVQKPQYCLLHFFTYESLLN
jgi:hypothetical protein